MINCRVHRWMGFAVCAALAASAVAAGTDASKLNPYHERMLTEEIQQSAAEVLACKDTDSRCLRQQDLCQKLVQAARFDEALQVANNICQTQGANEERRAVHHYLTAEIYVRKMKAALTLTEMEQNRQLAAKTIGDILAKGYPEKWGVTDHARVLLKDLNDQAQQNGVRQKVAARQGISSDNSREDIASAQRRYLDAKRGGGSSAPIARGGSATTPRERGTGFFKGLSRNKEAVKAATVTATSPGFHAASTSLQQAPLPSRPSVTRSLNTVDLDKGGRITFSNRLAETGMLTSQPGATTVADSGHQGLSISGANVSARHAVNQPPEKTLAGKSAGFSPGQQFSVRGTAASESSPYAAGQAPVIR